MIFTGSSSSQSLYLMSLTHKFPTIWDDPRQMTLETRRRGPERPAYLWDMHSLSLDVGTISSSDKNWQRLWVKNFQDDTGSRAYSAVETALTVSSFNQSSPEQHRYSGSFSLNPLVPQYVGDDNAQAPQDAAPLDTNMAEKFLYYAALFPGMPFVLTSSIPGAKHYGPVFITRIRFATSGQNKLSPVDIEVEFTGGKSIKLPTKKITAPKTRTYFNQTGVDDEGNPTGEEYEDWAHYRTANIMDCMSGEGIYETVSSMRKAKKREYQIEKLDPEANLVSIELNVSQEVEFSAPVPRKPFQENSGPRFASITKREVKGSLTFYSRQIKVGTAITTPITLFFGGPFLFPMPNVEWQPPRSVVQAGNGWLHTYDFIARAAPGAVIKGFMDSTNHLPVAEFSLPTNIVFENTTNE